MNISLDFIFLLIVVLLSIGLLLWFVLLFVPGSVDDINGPKD